MSDKLKTSHNKHNLGLDESQIRAEVLRHGQEFFNQSYNGIGQIRIPAESVECDCRNGHSVILAVPEGKEPRAIIPTV